MQIVQDVVPFSFNYTDPFQRSDLYVAFRIYDVTGSPALLTTIVGQYTDFGSYMGSYQGELGDRYLVIGLVYTDNTYTTVDTSAAQTADVFQVVPLNGQIVDFGFAYASVDYSSSLDIEATIYEMTSGTPALEDAVELEFIEHGVYYGQYTGALNNTYNVISVVYTDNTFTVPDENYAPASEEFDAIKLTTDIVVGARARLIGPVVSCTRTSTVKPLMHITQGDFAVFYLTAVDGEGIPVDLTGATFMTKINGPNGIVVTFDNSYHIANPDQVTNTGQFTLTLEPVDTAELGLGSHKEIITQITIGGSPVWFRGPNILQVYAPVPFE